MDDEIEIASDDADDPMYIIRGGESLSDIADHCGRSPVPLSECKHHSSDLIEPGVTLQLSSAESQDIGPIDACIYEFDTQTDDIPGKLFFCARHLFFQPDSPDVHPTDIEFITAGDVFLMPHPQPAAQCSNLDDDDVMYLLVVPQSDDSSNVLYFAARLADLRSVKEEIDHLHGDSEPIHVMYPQSMPTISSFGCRVHSPRLMRLVSLAEVDISGNGQILDRAQITLIREIIPKRFSSLDWELLFQMSNDGTSYPSLYRKAEKAEPVVLVIKTMAHEILGAYLSLGLSSQRRYYGTGETCVFGFSPHFQSYRWNGSNSFFVLSTNDEIALGGGPCAIWIGANMLDGHSEECATFGSRQLTTETNFKVAELEIWRIHTLRSQFHG
jgi:hypothetical protein